MFETLKSMETFDKHCYLKYDINLIVCAFMFAKPKMPGKGLAQAINAKGIFAK